MWNIVVGKLYPARTDREALSLALNDKEINWQPAEKRVLEKIVACDYIKGFPTDKGRVFSAPFPETIEFYTEATENGYIVSRVWIS